MIDRIGLEFEWLAPKGYSRKTFAQYLQGSIGGSMESFWHPQVEISKVPNTPLFHNLTQGFAVFDRQGKKIAHTVGDLTIQADLDRTEASKIGWQRIVSDDLRILNLIAHHAPSNELIIEDALKPIAQLFGTSLQVTDAIARVEDINNASVALGTGLPGERERVCEVVSGILEHPTKADIQRLLTPAQKLNFSIPKESATHIHFCARPLQQPLIFQRLIFFFHTYRQVLRGLCQTNSNCIRLGNWDPALLKTVRQADFTQQTWQEAQESLKKIPLSKYCDFNIKNTVFAFPRKNTFEVRILPGMMELDPIWNTLLLFQKIFTHITSHEVILSSPKADTPQNRKKLLEKIHAKNWNLWKKTHDSKS